MSWDASSSWVGWTRISLRRMAHLTVVVQATDASGTRLPPARQPTLSGTYELVTLAGGGPLRGHASGVWTANRVNDIPIAAHSTMVVRVRHPDYLDAEASVVLDAGRQAVTLTLTPRPPPT